MIEIKVDGMKEARKYFGKVPKALIREIGNALKASALKISAESKKVTPVDTGRLKLSIFTSIFDTFATVQPDTNYALYVHEGTTHMRPRPFMKWGLEASENDIRGYFEYAIKKAIENP